MLIKIGFPNHHHAYDFLLILLILLISLKNLVFRALASQVSNLHNMCAQNITVQRQTSNKYY